MTKTKNLLAPNGGTFTALETIEQITRDFVAKQEKRDDGSNSYLKDFLWAAQAVVTNCESSSFTLNDLETFSCHLETPREELTKYWDKWIAALEKAGRVRSENGCYTEKIYFFV